MSYEKVMEWCAKRLSGRGEKAALADRMGIPAATVSRWFSEGGESRKPNGEMLVTMIEALGATIVFPGEEKIIHSGCRNQEFEAVDKRVHEMRTREDPDPESVVAAYAIAALKAQFEKKCSPESTEQTKRAS
jgi:transcriptional regulator with XRE-family HTH domain